MSVVKQVVDAVAVDSDWSVCGVGQQEKVLAVMMIVISEDGLFAGHSLQLPRRGVVIMKKNPVNEMMAGVTAGATATLCLHPMDLLKTRLQVLSKKERAGNEILRIYRSAGLRGFYLGLVPNLLGSTCSWGTYFLIYARLKREATKTWHYGLAAFASSLSVVLLTSPLWFLKVRVCSQDPDRLLYSGTLDAVRKIYQSGGLRSFYAGIVPGMLGAAHGGIQFMVYERLKRDHDEFSNWDYIRMSSAAKIVASMITYPIHVTRARLQRQSQPVLTLITRLYREEGWRAFYGGWGLGTLRVMPGTWITFIVYERISKLLENKNY